MTTEERMQEFVKTVNSTNVQNSKTFSLEKSSITGTNEITLEFSSEISQNQMLSSDLSAAVTNLMIEVIRKEPENLKLMDQGVNFKIILRGKDGNIIREELINKQTITSQKPPTSQNKKHLELNQLLEISNANLPKKDPANGVTLTKINIGNEDDVIYTAEVPDAISKMISTPENREIIRKNMVRDTAFKKMVLQLKNFDIATVKYQYRTKSGKLLQEVKVQASDFR